jgi:hypothetical protein
MNSRLPGSAPQRFWLAGEQEEARVFYLLERTPRRMILGLTHF